MYIYIYIYIYNVGVRVWSAQDPMTVLNYGSWISNDERPVLF